MKGSPIFLFHILSEVILLTPFVLLITKPCFYPQHFPFLVSFLIPFLLLCTTCTSVELTRWFQLYILLFSTFRLETSHVNRGARVLCCAAPPAAKQWGKRPDRGGFCLLPSLAEERDFCSRRADHCDGSRKVRRVARNSNLWQVTKGLCEHLQLYLKFLTTRAAFLVSCHTELWVNSWDLWFSCTVLSPQSAVRIDCDFPSPSWSSGIAVYSIVFTFCTQC